MIYNETTISVSESPNSLNNYFRIKLALKTNNDSFYNIEEINTNKKLSHLKNKELNFTNEKNELQLWNFITINQTNFNIKGKDGCYIVVNKLEVICKQSPLFNVNNFKLLRIYSEVEEEKKLIDYQLINEEPIDILIKYIDLRDPNLNRGEIHQIEKDYDNQELRYSIRSILKNIPWIRKIFILMPNERVRFFKESNLIKEKIVYVKDKDFLGYDSSNPRAFQFRYWKMKKFGISNNIIIMDDDYFIGSKLEKTDFFHVNNGKVVPSITTSNFLKIDKISVLNERKYFETRAKSSREEQNEDIFDYCKYSTYAFVLNLFNKTLNESIFIPSFTHNAIPINLKDVEEIYDIVYNSDYKSPTLDSLYRNVEGLQFEIFISSYIFLKYDRKIKNIPNQFIKLNDSTYGNYNTSLFCINKGAGYHSDLKLYQEKIILEYLFPSPSPFEIVEYSLLNILNNLTDFYTEKIKLSDNQKSIMISKIEKSYIRENIILVFILLFFKMIYR